MDTCFFDWSYAACKVGCAMSDPCPVISGIPQGTVLIPILFLSFINDLPDIVDRGVDLSLFVDDVTICKCISDAAQRLALQANLNKFCQWSSDWQLPIELWKGGIPDYWPNPCCCIQYRWCGSAIRYCCPSPRHNGWWITQFFKQLQF